MCLCITAASVLRSSPMRTVRLRILKQLPSHPARARGARRPAVHLQRVRRAVPQRREATRARDCPAHGAEAAPVPTLWCRVCALLLAVPSPATVSRRETPASAAAAATSAGGHHAAGFHDGIQSGRIHY